MTDVWKDPEIIDFVRWLKVQGFRNVRLFISSRQSLLLSVQCQRLKSSEYGNTVMYFVEASWEGSYCCAYTDSLKDREEIRRRLSETAGIFDGRDLPEEIMESMDYRGQRWREIDEEKTIHILKCAEAAALSCKTVDFVEVCEYRQYEETVTLIDENMNYLTDDDGDLSFTVRVIAKEGDSVAASTKLGIVKAQDQDAFLKTACSLAERAAEYAGYALHAERIPSGTYPIVLENCVMAELTGHYLPVFYGENLTHHTSALAGKEGQQVGCRLLRLIEDPFSVMGTRRRRIDDEGMPVSEKVLLEKGVFRDILYNKKSAAQAGVRSSGNGFKPDAAADSGTSATNVLLLSEGETFSRREMLEASEGGIYITQIEGMFAGADTESGDFSLLACGNRIVDGRVSSAVNQFTISGNICGLWRDIEMIGDDPVYRLSGSACAVSPTVKVKSLTVSG